MNATNFEIIRTDAAVREGRMSGRAQTTEGRYSPAAEPVGGRMSGRAGSTEGKYTP